MIRVRIARCHNAVGDADPPGRTGGQHRHSPSEARLPGDLGEVVRAGLEDRHPTGEKLIAGEVAVIVGVRRRWGDIVGVDQVHHVLKCGDGLRIVEGEPVAVGEDPARRSDEVEIDALQIIGGVVAPLPDAAGVESVLRGCRAVDVHGESGQQWTQGVNAGVRVPARLAECGRVHAGGGE